VLSIVACDIVIYIYIQDIEYKYYIYICVCQCGKQKKQNEASLPRGAVSKGPLPRAFDNYARQLSAKFS
jgi:hypothetical protein